MAFVHVVELGLDTQHLEGADAADAKHDLLPEAHIQVTAIQLVGDVLVFTAIGVDVGVQQVEPDLSHVCAPDLCVDVATGIGDGHQERLALLVTL